MSRQTPEQIEAMKVAFDAMKVSLQSSAPDIKSITEMEAHAVAINAILETHEAPYRVEVEQKTSITLKQVAL